MIYLPASAENVILGTLEKYSEPFYQRLTWTDGYDFLAKVLKNINFFYTSILDKEKTGHDHRAM